MIVVRKLIKKKFSKAEFLGKQAETTLTSICLDALAFWVLYAKKLIMNERELIAGQFFSFWKSHIQLFTNKKNWLN